MKSLIDVLNVETWLARAKKTDEQEKLVFPRRAYLRPIPPEYSNAKHLARRALLGWWGWEEYYVEAKEELDE